jgi:hypothetical protein
MLTILFRRRVVRRFLWETLGVLGIFGLFLVAHDGRRERSVQLSVEIDHRDRVQAELFDTNSDGIYLKTRSDGP